MIYLWDSTNKNLFINLLEYRYVQMIELKLTRNKCNVLIKHCLL